MRSEILGANCRFLNQGCWSLGAAMAVGKGGLNCVCPFCLLDLSWILPYLASCFLAGLPLSSWSLDVLAFGLWRFGFLAFGFLTLLFGLSASSASPVTLSITGFWLFGFLVGGFVPPMFLSMGGLPPPPKPPLFFVGPLFGFVMTSKGKP